MGDAAFPRSAFEALGYEVAAAGEGSYAGVAIASRVGIGERLAGIEGFAEERSPGRRLLCRIEGRWVDNLYVPTRKAIGKVAFLEALRRDHLGRFGGDDEVVLAGDFNICFDRRDLASPKMISDAELHPGRPEDLAFRRLLHDAGLEDCFRRRTSDAGHYSWFPLTAWAMKRNYGMRLDYVFGTPALAQRVVEAVHDREPRGWERPSDHLPLRVRFGEAVTDGEQVFGA